MEMQGIICGDSDVLLQTLLEKNIKADLILTDPPYNLNKDFGNNSDCLTFEDFINTSKHRINVCKNLLKDDASIVWFGIHHYIGFLQNIMYEAGLHYRRMNIWFYENGFNMVKNAPTTQYEPFLWFSKSEKKWTYNTDDVRVPYKSTDRLKKPVYYRDRNGNKKIWTPNPLGALRGDVWQFPTLSGNSFKKERTSHPTQKPISLFMEIIKAFCPKNKDGLYDGLIIDPFHGSGTLGVCCEILNKQGHKIRWIGIEKEQKWCDIATKRLEVI